MNIQKTNLSDAMKRLIELDLAKPKIDAFYEELDATIRKVQEEVGLDGHFQAEDGTVYKIVKPAGTFVSFKDVNFVRTKREGERAGSLSVKLAEEAGYTVPKT